MLRVDSLEVSLGRTRVLHGVSLDVADGEVLALVGANGAGKTTLLRAVSGLVASQRGSISFGGQDITRADPVDRVGLGLVQVPGGQALWDSMTVAETLATACYTLPRSEIPSRTDEVLDLFPALAPRLGQRAGTLSGGERQLLALAKALALRPRLLVVDELSLGLAPVLVAELLRTLIRLRDSGTAMLVVEQSAATVARLASRTVTLEKGRTLA